MENFFIDENFFSGTEELLEWIEIDEDEVKDLPDDWFLEIEGSTLEKVFPVEHITKKFVADAIVERLFNFEDRLPDDSDRLFLVIRKAIELSVDIDTLNEQLPSLWYPNGNKFRITKADLL